MKRLKSICLLLMLLIAGVQYTYARQIYVVSAGICKYKYINPLQKAENDARQVAQLYGTHTRNVTLLLGAQATRSNIISTMRSVYSRATDEDVVIFMFSGHGTQGGLCAYDTSSPDDVVTYREIQSVMRSSRANTKMLFIDACYSGGLRSTSKKSTSAQRIFNDERQGIMLFLSSKTAETSMENRWGDNGYFTQYLVSGLKGGADTNGDRIVTAKEIFTFVSTRVKKATGNRQHPVMWGKFSDNMHVMNWNKRR